MKMRQLTLVALIIFSGLGIRAQETAKSVDESRKENLISLLNYRYKGGFFTFERLFTATVTYPDVARANCIMGIALLELTIDCDGNIASSRIKNPMGYGIEQEISNFVLATEGAWNNCNDNKYTKMQIPIQFRTANTETAEGVALLVCEGDTPGMICNSDDYYLKKAEKLIEKGRGRKALQYLDILINRNPYDLNYQELRKRVVESME